MREVSFGAWVTVRFHLFGYWEWSNRDRARKERIKSGYTSLRVTKDTARKLEHLARQIAATHPGWTGGNKIALDELLSAIATARPAIATAENGNACKEPIGDLHASSIGVPRDRRGK